MNKAERQAIAIGIAVSTWMLLAFSHISTQFFTLSLNGMSQFLITLSVFSLLIIITEKNYVNIINISKDNLLIYGLMTASALSILNTEYTLTSTKRLITMVSATLITFLGAKYTTKPQKLFLGFSIGIIAVTIASTLYGLIAAVVDFNFVNRQPYELVEFKFFGLEFQQTIAHRAFMLDDSTYYIQRYAGIFPNPNGLGLMAGISFALSHTLPVRKKFKYLVQILCLIGLSLSLSRMGFLLCAASFIYYYTHNTRIRQTICVAMIGGLLSFLITTVSSFELSGELGYQSRSLIDHEIFQLRERTYLMAQAWLGFLENWPVGVGFGVGAEYLFPDKSETLAVHSVFLNAALETGLLGITFLLATWLLPVFTTKTGQSQSSNSEHLRHVISSVMFGLFFAEAFDLSVMRFHYIHLIFFFLLGIWSALGHDPKDTAGQDVQSSDTSNTLSKQMESRERSDR